MADCFTRDTTRVMHVSVLSAFSFATLVSVILRLCARKIQRMELELNDYLCLVGLVCSRPLKYSPNAHQTLDLYLRNDSLHNAFHHISSPRPSQPRRKLGRQRPARGTAPLGNIRDFRPSVCPDSLYANLPDAVFSYHLLRSPRLQFGLFCVRSPSLLLDMPAFRIPLGSVH